MAEGVVDRDGNPFPEGVDHGGYLIYGTDRPLKARLMVKEHQVSQRLEAAAPFYQGCNYVLSFFLSDASPVTLNIGQTRTIYPKCEMSNGSVYAESGSTHWSDYPSIASVSGTGTSRVITGLSPGLTWIDGETTQASDEFCTPLLFQQDQPKEVTIKPLLTIESTTFNPSTITTDTTTLTVSVFNQGLGGKQVTISLGEAENNCTSGCAVGETTIPLEYTPGSTMQKALSTSPAITKYEFQIRRAPNPGTAKGTVKIRSSVTECMECGDFELRPPGGQVSNQLTVQ